MIGEIPQRIACYERAGIELRPFTKSIETLGGLSKYATCLGFSTQDSFIAFIEKKRILDISAGYDGFAIESVLKGINCNIVSNNLNRRRGNLGVNRLKALQEHEDFCHYSHNLIEEAIKIVDRTATSDFAQELHFSNDSFDCVIDINGIFYYATLEEIASLYKSIIQMYRVTKYGGKILIGDRFFFLDDGRQPRWKEDLLQEIGISYHPIRSDIYSDPYGVVITKGY